MYIPIGAWPLGGMKTGGIYEEWAKSIPPSGIKPGTIEGWGGLTGGFDGIIEGYGG